jgi:hypothetical protein
MATPETKVNGEFDDLFADKSLFFAFIKSPTVFSNRFNGICAAVAIASLSGFAIWETTHQRQLPSSFTETFALWANVGWTLSATLLGFLIAGFSLLATSLSASAVRALHDYKPEGEKNNRLRDLFLFFVDIFVGYLCLLAFSLLMVLVTSPGGFGKDLRSLLTQFGPCVTQRVGYGVLVVWASWLVILLLKLKSFVYNLYQCLVYAMAVNAMEDK